MTDEGPILGAHGLAKRYDRAISRGGITALVGPNAAGKSTLIKTWVGFERPSRRAQAGTRTAVSVSVSTSTRVSAPCVS